MIFAGKTVTGKGVKVAIVDTGIQGNFSQPVDSWDVFLSSSGKIIPKLKNHDLIGRGSQLAALVLEEAPSVQLIGVNIFNEQGKTNSDILAAGIQFAIEQAPNVICVCVNTNNPEKMARFQYLCKQAESRDIMIVSSHPISEKISYPSSLPGVVPVLTHPKIKSRFFYSDPDEFTPEKYVESGFFWANGSVDGRFMGKEYATARMAGKIACLREARPELWVSEIIERLRLKAFLPVGEMSAILTKISTKNSQSE